MSMSTLRLTKWTKIVPDIATGQCGDLLFNDRGKVAGFTPTK